MVSTAIGLRLRPFKLRNPILKDLTIYQIAPAAGNIPVPNVCHLPDPPCSHYRLYLRHKQIIQGKNYVRLSSRRFFGVFEKKALKPHHQTYFRHQIFFKGKIRTQILEIKRLTCSVSPHPKRHGPHGLLHSCRYHSPAGHPIEAEKAEKALD